MKPKITKKTAHIPDSFSSEIYKTERTCCAKIAEWINRFIDENQMDFGPAEVETRSADDKYPDVIILSNPRANDVVCVMEFKQPFFDPFNEKELKNPAHEKTARRHASYFVTSNFQELIWWNQKAVNESKADYEQIVNRYSLSKIENLNDIEDTRYKESIKKILGQFILKLYSVYNKKEAEPKQAVDEFLVYWLHSKVNRLARLYFNIIENTCHKDQIFFQNLQRWFNEQGWDFTWQPGDFSKAARQAAYLLVNKIIFYDLLQTKRPDQLDPLEIPETMTQGSLLQKNLSSYFAEVLKIDYETVFGSNFIDSATFHMNRDIVNEIRDIVNLLRKYDFSKLGFEIIGRIFERIIPPDERHNLGQYFTSADVVDLILNFCLRHEDDMIIDPACGAGTFLVRAYQHKKLMNQYKSHEDILRTLWGNDIAKFPAHLATINLAVNDLSVDQNYPNIMHEDFFKLLSSKDGFEAPASWRKARMVTLGADQKELFYPRWFDVLVGNPPYTRQEEIPDIGVDKDVLIENALKDADGKVMAEISRRSGIHAYFFIHGTKFLKDGGRFGFIVSNTWLDVEYGKGLQEFFLHYYKIVAIIESKVERWFPGADINTSIVILEKCRDKNEREINYARFVYLKKPLRELYPAAQDLWEKQVGRLNDIEKLKRTILAHNDFYENEEMKIYPITQKELWNEGYDAKEKKYIGSKWGKYIRAPVIYFKIIEKVGEKLVPLKEIADVRFGIKTGANEFFYLSEEEIKLKKIEKEYWMHKNNKGELEPNYVIEKANESKKAEIDPDNLKCRVLFINKSLDMIKNKGILLHIKHGERKNYDSRPTCESRGQSRPWFDLGENINDPIALPERTRLRHVAFYNPRRVSLNKNLYGVSVKKSGLNKTIAVMLNSTLTALFLEIFSRQPGGGGGPLDMDVIVAQNLLIPNVKLIEKFKKQLLKLNILKRNIESVFKEIGTEDKDQINMDSVSPDRCELDAIVMNDMLGLTENDQLDVYRAVVDMVKSRIEKAQSVESEEVSEDGIYVNKLREKVIDQLVKEPNP